jgi:hypothetical protein
MAASTSKSSSSTRFSSDPLSAYSRVRRSAPHGLTLELIVAVRLARDNACLEKRNANHEKRIRQLECGMLKSAPAAEDVQLLAAEGDLLLAEEYVELVGAQRNSAELHADLAAKAIEPANSDEQRHRTNAIFFLLRVAAPRLYGC